MKKSFTIKISEEVLSKINSYCEEEGKIKSFVIEKAISDYLDNIEDKKKKIEIALEALKENTN